EKPVALRHGSLRKKPNWRLPASEDRRGRGAHGPCPILRPLVRAGPRCVRGLGGLPVPGGRGLGGGLLRPLRPAHGPDDRVPGAPKLPPHAALQAPALAGLHGCAGRRICPPLNAPPDRSAAVRLADNQRTAQRSWRETETPQVGHIVVPRGALAGCPGVTLLALQLRTLELLRAHPEG
ncbi:unnamed protein product, partial [Ixodes pacificus]